MPIYSLSPCRWCGEADKTTLLFNVSTNQEYVNDIKHLYVFHLDCIGQLKMSRLIDPSNEPKTWNEAYSTAIYWNDKKEVAPVRSTQRLLIVFAISLTLLVLANVLSWYTLNWWFVFPALLLSLTTGSLFVDCVAQAKTKNNE